MHAPLVVPDCTTLDSVDSARVHLMKRGGLHAYPTWLAIAAIRGINLMMRYIVRRNFHRSAFLDMLVIWYNLKA